MSWFSQTMAALLDMKAKGQLGAKDLISAAFSGSRQPYGLEEVFGFASFSMYKPDSYQGLTADARSKLDSGTALAVTVAATSFRQVVIGNNLFRRESDSWPWQAKVNIDTAGQIVHELFHVAGFGDNLFKWYKVNGQSLNDAIHEHCGIVGATMK